MAWKRTRRLTTGWVTLPSTTGTVAVFREDSRVEVSFSNMRPPATGDFVIVDLPAGFRPSRLGYGIAGESAQPRVVQALSYAPFQVKVLGIAAAQSWMSGSVSFLTSDPMPTGGA